MKGDKGWKRVRADWRDVVLVCRKCAKKLDGGFGPDGDERFAKALRRALDEGEARKVKALRREVAVVEVGCLDVCPKRAVVVVKGSEPKSLFCIPEKAPMDEVIETLRLQIGNSKDEASAVTHYLALVEHGDMFGLVFPDCPGAVAQAETFDDVMRDGTVALREWMADRIAAGIEPPAPRSIADLRADPTLSEDFAADPVVASVPLLLDAGR